jgi:Tetratricopeptide repeat
VEWSYDLLTEPEQRLLGRLSVFAGGWTLETAEAVCGDDGIDAGAVLKSLTALVEKSLVVYEEQHPPGNRPARLVARPRYHMLETIREYALERLAESGEAPARREQHARFFVALAERAEPTLGTGSSEEEIWLDRLETEHDNLRVALDWSVASHECEVGLRLAGSLQPFWMRQFHVEEGRSRLAVVLEMADPPGCTAVRAKALRAAGTHAFHRDDPSMLALLEESLEIERQLDNKPGIAASLYGVAGIVGERGDREGARRLLEESLAIYRQLGDEAGIVVALQRLGRYQSDLGAANTLLNECLAIHRRLGNRLMMAWTLWNMGVVAVRHRDPGTALQCYEEGLPLFREANNAYGIAIVLREMADAALAHGNWSAAHPWLTEAHLLFQEMGKRDSRIHTLLGLGIVAYQRGELARASDLYQEALVLS